MKRVGILGGMGPEATVLLMARVLAATPARDDADHIPLIVHQNPQVPSRIKRLIEGTGDDPGPVLVQMARDLQAAGAQALAMPCNTAHAYAAALPRRVPLLDMVALSVAAAAARGGRAAVLGSPALAVARVFEAALAARGMDFAYAHDLDLIRAVKREGATASHRAAFARLAAAVDADIVIVACTEFSLLAAPDPRLIDSLDVLVGAIVAFAKGSG